MGFFMEAIINSLLLLHILKQFMSAFRILIGYFGLRISPKHLFHLSIIVRFKDKQKLKREVDIKQTANVVLVRGVQSSTSNIEPSQRKKKLWLNAKKNVIKSSSCQTLWSANTGLTKIVGFEDYEHYDLIPMTVHRKLLSTPRFLWQCKYTSTNARYRWSSSSSYKLFPNLIASSNLNFCSKPFNVNCVF